MKHKALSILSTLLFILVGCQSKDKNSDDANTSGFSSTLDYNPSYSGTIVDDSNPKHHIDHTVHEIKETITNKVFAIKGETLNCQIVYDEKENNSAQAARYIANHLRKATSCETSILKQSETTYEKEGKTKLYIGCDSLFKASQLNAPETEVGTYGYSIKNDGNNMFLMANSYSGYNLGALRILRALVGFDAITYEQIIYRKREKTLPLVLLDGVEIPDFLIRQAPGYAAGSYYYDMGENEVPFIYNSNYNWIHNVYSAMGQYYDKHPDWFDSHIGLDPITNTQVHQLCYPAHGNEDSRKEEVQAAADFVIRMMIDHPDKHLISFTQEDSETYCDCDACQREFVKYNTNAGAMIKFINDMDTIIQNYIHDETRDNKDIIPTNHELTLFCFAYHDTVTAPSKYNEAKQTYDPIDQDIVMHPSVGVIIAPSYAKYTHSFYEEVNSSIAKQIQGWGALTNNIYAYTYCNNFRGYFYPFNSFETDIENLRFFKENGGRYCYDSCSFENPQVPGFMELKKYLLSRLMVDTNLDENSLTQAYFTGAYSLASNTMYDLYLNERNHLKSIEGSYTGIINDDSSISNSSLWPYGLMNQWWEMTKTALKEISDLQKNDPANYSRVRNNIILESLTPRFVLATLHEDSYTEEELNALRRDLKHDIEALGILAYAEHTGYSVEDLFDGWGM